MHIMAFQYVLRDMPTVANRGVDILVKMFNLAESWGWRTLRARNPCRYVRRYQVEKHYARFLTPLELYRMGTGAGCSTGRTAERRPTRTQ